MNKWTFILSIGFIIFAFILNIFGLMRVFPLLFTSVLLFLSLLIFVSLLNNQHRFRGFK
ncbi:hypothetical protein ACWE42_19770 [Sutcliffiella cohnii]|uniref:hypothetical protein n=1 Tax=Sutcliffiella TaxID=2837511 RepID=UPI000ADF27D6|nr:MULTISPECIES: hypothetical protein [Sutcliffiella]MED4016905.1 hypothetical protein [Sutcliffiella cohnii]WBL16269.1 hypothetical protein O1A01_06465 [Sutcliffiella sp. NC1]